MSSPGESEIISMLQKSLGGRFVPEDVEQFCISGRTIVANVDSMVQSTDIPDRMSISDAARKSVAACASDFAAKGVRPSHGMVSLVLPEGTTAARVGQIARGIRRASTEFGIKILGGDTSGGRELAFHVCLFGAAARIVPRRGAAPDDLVFASGPFGYAASGLEILLGNAGASGRFKSRALGAFCRPAPRIEFGARCGNLFTSSMDSSDGLSTTLAEMARQSRCRLVISRPPAGSGVAKFAESNGLDADRLVLHGGEEYEIVFTIPARHKRRVHEHARITGTPILEIGSVERGAGVLVERDGQRERLHDYGWRHL